MEQGIIPEEVRRSLFLMIITFMIKCLQAAQATYSLFMQTVLSEDGGITAASLAKINGNLLVTVCAFYSCTLLFINIKFAFSVSLGHFDILCDYFAIWSRQHKRSMF